ncbi:hypothetical protein A3A67_01535 [Candidatus Peribacteria bacterium RIFCSPLOWO2_01_FULL_51_18]|nr:MAG: hypothetical protein A3C52_01335 [Candidatus Peribacteria bacterium RIFCSPHIGHO2_02_FULL_51_15]OGJ65069.1 MAG: hypothetical protein A3A67_01535 [Candidatus Peribacteria bacterium RIFCSPLOWO2_01_FULL_51_18]OGJ69828.1 MAG: hypothetical protein A3J34_04430 [Candidatus Peribacteria bacterium RIFCSPLOWO2_02_FULL_51_10]
MPTKKRRINITLKKDVALYLKKLALRDDMPEATKAAQMIELAMEIEEDLYFSRIADERFRNMKKTVSAAEFWAKVL